MDHMKRLLTALTIASTIGFAMPTLAATTILSKKQLAVPRIDWRVLPSAIRNLPQDIRGEMDCGDTSYRVWTIDVPTPDPQSSSGYAVFEARRGSIVKWKTLPGGWAASPTGSGGYNFFRCGDDGVYLVPYLSFTDPATWAQPGIQRGYVSRSNGSYYYEKSWEAITVDGIVQVPGTLTLTSTGILGDSRPATISKGRVINHTLPWYRDLNAVPRNQTGITLKADFFRLRDGYGVRETEYLCSTSEQCTEKGIKFYRIRNGESAYTQVETLPFQHARLNYVSSDDNGVTLKQWSDFRTIGLIHGLPAPLPGEYSDYRVTGAVVNENGLTVWVRYLIENTKTQRRQYWEATVQR